MRRTLIVVLSVLFLFASGAFADNLVTNPSFETLPDGVLLQDCGGRGCFSEATIPGWTNTGFSGQFQPNPGIFNTPFLPGDVTIAYTNAGPITQTIDLQHNTNYIFTIDIGSRNDYPGAGIAELVIGGDTFLASGRVPSIGGWSTYSYSFNSGSNDSVTIELLQGPLIQGDFDHASLTATPEPSSLILLGTGLIGFAGAIRRKLAK